MSEIPKAEVELLAGAERRLGRVILFFLPVGTGVAAWRWDGWLAGAFAFGGALAYLNYRWVVAVVDALVRAQSTRIPASGYLKLFLPLVLLVGVLYVIFSRAFLPLAGVVAGLLLLVVAIFVEAMYEIYLAVRA